VWLCPPRAPAQTSWEKPNGYKGQTIKARKKAAADDSMEAVQARQRQRAREDAELSIMPLEPAKIYNEFGSFNLYCRDEQSFELQSILRTDLSSSSDEDSDKEALDEENIRLLGQRSGKTLDFAETKSAGGKSRKKSSEKTFGGKKKKKGSETEGKLVGKNKVILSSKTQKSKPSLSALIFSMKPDSGSFSRAGRGSASAWVHPASEPTGIVVRARNAMHEGALLVQQQLLRRLMPPMHEHAQLTLLQRTNQATITNPLTKPNPTNRW